jgi:lipopolysaccharide/colanic/teichoic acid biosynthesis glycosyltransferase
MFRSRKNNLIAAASLLFYIVFAVAVLAAGDYIIIGKGRFLARPDSKVFLVLMAACIWTTAFICHRLLVYPNVKRLEVIISTTLVVFVAAALVILLSRIFYSRPFVIYAGVMTLLGVSFWSWFRRRHEKVVLGYLPFGTTREIIGSISKRSIEFVEIRLAELNMRDFDAVVADLHSAMPPECYKFLAECLLTRKKVYHSAELYEIVTGRISLDHVSEVQLEDFSPSSIFRFLKRIFDIVVSLLSLPFILPLILISALLIRIESHGSPFFIQDRIGEGGRIFKIYKLRTMWKDAESNGASFASAQDDRITRLGGFLRKTRIDELPQVFNILRGEMSWIGPRPEQKKFVAEFETSIPFYGYRHILKPGLTGWAQVMHGYAADSQETRRKLGYDFFYIKYASIWLDVLIVYRTVRTILTGFGAR